MGLKLESYIVACALLLFCSGFTRAQGTESQEMLQLRHAFLLGTTYALATRYYVSRESLNADGRGMVSDMIKRAKIHADRLGITIEETFPVRQGLIKDDKPRIFQIVRQRGQQISLSLRSNLGIKHAAIFELGFRTIIAQEYVPDLPAARQAELAAEFRPLAEQSGVPPAILDKLLKGYSQSPVTKQDVLLVFDFENDVLAHLENKLLRYPEIARQMHNTWELGVKISLSALGRAEGADGGAVERLFAESRILAKALGVKVPELHEETKDKTANQVHALIFLLDEASEPIAKDLGDRYGDRFSAIYELAIKSSIAMLLYSGEDGGRDSTTTAIIAAIERTGRKSGLPEALWRPVVLKMQQSAPYRDVKAEIIKMEAEVGNHLLRLTSNR